MKKYPANTLGWIRANAYNIFFMGKPGSFYATDKGYYVVSKQEKESLGITKIEERAGEMVSKILDNSVD
jgi:hypothetical protein